jgi:hypothetical protein
LELGRGERKPVILSRRSPWGGWGRVEGRRTVEGKR